jgi:hypothetical protein
VHKTANVLNKLPKSQQPKATRALLKPSDEFCPNCVSSADTSALLRGETERFSNLVAFTRQ